MSDTVDTSKEAVQRLALRHDAEHIPSVGYDLHAETSDVLFSLLRERDQLRREAEEARSVRDAAQEVCDVAVTTYKARNGKMCSIEADDGEACEIVHSDAMHQLRQALKARP